jgi:pyruvate kinase
MTIRQTKIVATLGKSSSDEDTLEAMIQAGINVTRHNLSHGSVEEHFATVRRVRDIAQRLDTTVACLFDLQGPKIRIERFVDGQVELQEGQLFCLDSSLAFDEGTQEHVAIAYKDLPRQVKKGNVLLLDDGRIMLRVTATTRTRITCEVISGGMLGNRKGINLEGGGLAAPALTEDDIAQIKASAAEVNPDYFAVSFVSTADDVHRARQLVRQHGGHGGIIAKIERREALDNLESIMHAADAVMIARGDLGVEIGDAALPAIQKHILRMARSLNRPVITATQMMESMIECPVPTRAEVIDVANAVIDGTDAVMLSGETASGKYPVKVVAKMDEIIRSAEAQPETRITPHLESRLTRIDETIAMSAMFAATHANIKAVVAITESGSTSLSMSRVTGCVGLPIYAMTPHPATRGRVMLYRSVHPVEFVTYSQDHATVVSQAINRLRADNLIQNGDTIIITKGSTMREHGATSIMEILEVEEQD